MESDTESVADTDDIEKLHTTQQVADIFEVGAQTVRVWITKKKFPGARRVNGRWRIPHSDVVAMANGNHG